MINGLKWLNGEMNSEHVINKYPKNCSIKNFQAPGGALSGAVKWIAIPAPNSDNLHFWTGGHRINTFYLLQSIAASFPTKPKS